ncbi:MAG: antioxidant protein [Pseudomonadota bacterium]
MPVEVHHKWKQDIATVTGSEISYPLIGDPNLEVAKRFGMLPANASDTGFRTAADNHTVRSVFVIGPDKRIKLTMTYPMSTGRDFGEVLRAIDSLQLTAGHKVATPADWRQGDDVIILPSLDEEAAREAFPGGWDARTPYMRVVPQPT